MDLGPLIPIVAILSGLGWGVIGLKKRAMTLQAEQLRHSGGTDAEEKRRLEQRVATLEKIITDGGLQTAAQIEALRDVPLSRSPVPAGEGHA